MLVPGESGPSIVVPSMTEVPRRVGVSGRRCTARHTRTRRNRTCGATVAVVPNLRISEVASLLCVSDDTVRRWVDAGRLPSTLDASGVTVVSGEDVAGLATGLAAPPDPGGAARPSARNRLRGIVTRVVTDTVMAQVEIQAGPFRLVSLLSAEAVAELGLQVGSPATAVVKATNVGVEVSP